MKSTWMNQPFEQAPLWRRSPIKNWAYLLLIPLAWMLTSHFGIAINLSESLPQKVWLIRFAATPARGDYVLFKAPLSLGLARDLSLIKQVMGMPGDEVLRLDRDFWINGAYVARAKAYALTGEALKPGPQGLLAEGQYYVWSPHQDSFDSRYAKMGWVARAQLLGVAYAIW